MDFNGAKALTYLHDLRQHGLIKHIIGCGLGEVPLVDLVFLVQIVRTTMVVLLQEFVLSFYRLEREDH